MFYFRAGFLILIGESLVVFRWQCVIFCRVMAGDNDQITYWSKDHSLSLQMTELSNAHSMTSAHQHPWYEFFFLESGERNYLIHNKMTQISPGELVVIVPNDIHRSVTTPLGYYRRWLLRVSVDRVRKILSEGQKTTFEYLDRSFVVSFPDEERASVLSLYHAMQDEFRENRQEHEAIVQAYLTALLLKAIRLRHVARELAAPMNPMYRLVAQVGDWINDHYQEDCCLERVASEIGLSPTWLSRRFHQASGSRFHNYVQMVRFREARRLLKDTEMKVNEVARATGFTDLPNFHRKFKALSGLSPRDYRTWSRAPTAIVDTGTPSDLYDNNH